jgi:trigger factor
MEKDAYLEASGVSVEEVAKEALKQDLAIELIAEKEKLTLDKDEYKAKLKEYTTTNGFESAEQCEEAYGKEELEKTFLRDKVADFLLENCKLVESTEKAE